MQVSVAPTLRVLVLLLAPLSAMAEDEVSLFSDSGKAEAYIAIDDELAIYLWSGKPVAYLERDSTGGFHVYGFNGKHLGWFVKGAVWDHDGKASCAVKEVLKSTEYEPYKAYKQYKPYKDYKEYAPYRPHLSNSVGDTSCRFLLGGGGEVTSNPSSERTSASGPRPPAAIAYIER